MVEERVTDGVRIAELLASEVTGRADGPLADLRVTETDPDVEPTTDGAFAYAVERTASGGPGKPGARLAEVYVHPDRTRVEFLPAGDDAGAASGDDAGADDAAVANDDAGGDDAGAGDDAAGTDDALAAAVEAVAAADRGDLRARPKAVRPPRTLVFVESGAAVKAAVDVLASAATATAGSEG